MQFLKTIYNEGLLKFDPKVDAWRWDLQEIHTICSTTNVVEFMVQTLSKFDGHTQHILKIAACLGVHSHTYEAAFRISNVFFSIGNNIHILVLSIATEQEVKAIQAGLEPALQEEYIVQLDETHIKFAHDRIQQAAYSLISLR